MKRWLRFDTMPTSVPARVLFGIFTFALLFLGIAITVKGSLQFVEDRTGTGFILLGVFICIAGPFIARVWAELTLVISKLHKKLVSYLED